MTGRVFQHRDTRQAYYEAVRIETANPVRVTPLPVREPASSVKKEDAFWRDLRSDIRDYLLHFDQEKMEDFSNLFKGLGNGLKGAWQSIRDIPPKVLNHPIVADRVDKDDRDRWSDFGHQAGMIAGFTAAGGLGVAGLLKVSSGIKHRNLGRGLDGLVDIASSTSLALAVAGLTGARALVSPIAASVNLVRGVYNTATGFRRGDERKQIQGVLDVSRSLGGLSRSLRTVAPVLGAVGMVFAPITGVLQASRGVYDIGTGIKNNDNKKEVKGLADIAMAVGTALAFASGAAVIPGIALAVAANVLKIGYQASPKFRRRVDKIVDKAEPKLAKLVSKTEQATRPVVQAYKRIMGRFIKKTDAMAPERFSRAQLAEISQLLHSDGRYSREEYRRLRTTLEAVGQTTDLPRQTAEPLPLRRGELKSEMDSKADRLEFVRFMLVVADYDFQAVAEEIAHLGQLSGELGIDPSEFQKLVDERSARRLQLMQAVAS